MVDLTIEQFFTGCIEPVKLTRRVYDSHNLPRVSVKVFHLVVRAGMLPGERYKYENCGDETPDLSPGDVVFVLRASVDESFARHPEHPRDVVLRAPPIPAGDVMFAFEFMDLGRYKRWCSGSSVGAVLQSMLQNAAGLHASVCYTGEGLPAPVGSHSAPGDLHVHIPVPAVPRPAGLAVLPPVHSPLRPRSVYLIGVDASPSKVSPPSPRMGVSHLNVLKR
ncbi:hypothetical protein CYMTET_12175 [Cymbomonas tetramitiformis]|uniref:Chaperone DnaJ C-terminal domain-containing protein n=1 Tax=Cymbomonas tetramitiformis TaxID=36881 RepID=A0AAE0GM85_9CHLO|nr:hypothetical protein CYMTET_12175 [Cymbomonas tetramitiformis]